MKKNLRIILLGGGHAHALVLKLWGRNPIPGVSLTLITDVKETPYSGMLPGLVAGIYSHEETHINLVKLAKFAGADLVLDSAIGVNLLRNSIQCKINSPQKFDYLSIDIGSTPLIDCIPGSVDYAIPIKPVPQFLSVWRNLLQRIAAAPELPVTIVIVGGGAGGVELALSMQTHLQRIMNNSGKNKLEIVIVHSGNRLLPNHNLKVSNIVKNLLSKRDIKIYCNEKVQEIQQGVLKCYSGLELSTDYIFISTQASPTKWISESELATDEHGFIIVNDALQSVSHPQVFASGDIATMKNYKRPKAGIFAVRQGPPLFANLQGMAMGSSLYFYKPQFNYLALIGTGDKRAIASWGNWACCSSILWHLKEYIDRKFMKQFEKLDKVRK